MMGPAEDQASLGLHLDQESTELSSDLEQEHGVDSSHLRQLALIQASQGPGKVTMKIPENPTKYHLSSRDKTSSSSVSEIPFFAAVM